MTASPIPMTPPTITRADRDAWERDGPRIFHCDMTGPECLAAQRELGAREERALVVEWLRTNDCAHFVTSLQDCEFIAGEIERGYHLTKGEG